MRSLAVSAGMGREAAAVRPAGNENFRKVSRDTVMVSRGGKRGGGGRGGMEKWKFTRHGSVIGRMEGGGGGKGEEPTRGGGKLLEEKKEEGACKVQRKGREPRRGEGKREEEFEGREGGEAIKG